MRSTTNKKMDQGNEKRMLGIWVGGRRRKPVVTGPGKAERGRTGHTHKDPQVPYDFSAIRK